MVKCPYCGVGLREGDKFCYSCGADVTLEKEKEVTKRRKYREEREYWLNDDNRGNSGLTHGDKNEVSCEWNSKALII